MRSSRRAKRVRLMLVAAGLCTALVTASDGRAQETTEDDGIPPRLSDVTLVREATVGTVRPGDAVVLTVRARSASGPDVTPGPGLAGQELGGAVFVDVLPKGMRAVPGTARILVGGASIPAAMDVGPALVRIGRAPTDGGGGVRGVALAAGAELTVRYTVAVALDVEPETVARFTGRLRTPGGVALTADAGLTLRVEREALFDEALVLGRVFCDADGDGHHDEGEQGLGGVRVYADTGRYAETDRHGGFHLRGFRPGNHLIKPDARSLPPGSTFTTKARRLVMLTPGLVERADFGVTCEGLQTVRPGGVTYAPPKGGDATDLEVALPTGLGPVALVTGVLDPPAIHLDGEPLPALGAALRLVDARGEPLKGALNVSWAPGALDSAVRFQLSVRPRPPGRTAPAVGAPSVSTSTSASAPVSGDEARDEADGGDGEAVAAAPGSEAPTDTTTPAPEPEPEPEPAATPAAPTEPMDWPVGASWRLSIHEVQHGGRPDVLVREWFGREAPPEQVAWNGTDATGALGLLERGGLYRATLTVADGRGQTLSSPVVSFGASYGAGAPIVQRLVLRGVTDRTGRPSRRFGQALRRLVDAVRDTPRARVLIDVHTDPSGSNDVDVSRTRRTAFLASEIAAEVLTVDPSRVIGTGHGASEPLRPNIGEANRAYNRRIVVTVLPPEDPSRFRPPPEAPVKPGVWLDGDPVALGVDGSYVVAVPRRPDRARNVAVEVVSTDGSRRQAWVTVAPLDEATDQPVAGPASPSPAVVEAAPGTTFDDVPGVPTFGGAGARAGIGEVRVDVDTPDAEASDGSAASAGPAAAGVDAELEADPLRRFGGVPLREALGTKAVLPGQFGRGADGEEVTADQLEVTLPPEGTVLDSERLWVSGSTHPDNRVTVAGKPVHVGDDGRFEAWVTLPAGKSVLVVAATDASGNTATIRHPVEVGDMAFFLLALADGAVGQLNTPLVDRREHTSLDVGPVHLQGRGALVFKGRVSGSALAEHVFFTAHVDSEARAEFTPFYEQIIDPDRDYALYGDASEEIVDAKARGPFYVMVQADKSALELGSIRTDLQGVELFRYQRSFYGIRLRAHRAWAEGWDSQIDGFVTEDHTRIVRGADELRATGGSLYHLSGQDLIEGSEQVWLVVREVDTNLELARVKAVRDRDYRMDYDGGRLTTRAPIPFVFDSLATVAALQDLTGRAILRGHAVWLEVDYEMRGTGAGEGVAFGVYGRQKLAGLVEVGGGYVEEQRPGGQSFQMLGAHAKLDWGGHTSARVEYAETLNGDTTRRLSRDGGLTYLEGTRSAGEAHGLALKATVDSQLGEAFGIADDLKLRVRGWYHVEEPSFASTASILDAGRERWGGELTWLATDDDRLSVRYDGGTALVPDVRFDTGLRAVKRNWVVGRYSHRFAGPRLHLDVEVGGGQHRDDADGEVEDTVFGMIGFRWRPIDRLTLGLHQEVVPLGDQALIGDVNDDWDLLGRFATHLELGIQVTDDLALVLGETIRWDGDNATRLGVRSRIDEDTTAYVEERLDGDLDGRGGIAHQSVFGLERRFGEDGSGRTYGEYRLDGGVGGRTSQAVLGVGKRFQLAEGVRLSAGWEHIQTLGGLEGAFARDVVSAGLEVMPIDGVRYGGRYELRWDRGDATQGEVERLQAVVRNGLTAKLAETVTLMGQANYALTQDLTNRQKDSEQLDLSTALVYRPHHADWLTMLLSYQHRMRIDAEPTVDLLGETGRLEDRRFTDLAAFTAIIDMPLGFRLTEKVAYKHVRASTAGKGGTPGIDLHQLLWINRLGVVFLDALDVSAEYRLRALYGPGGMQEIEHGALAELGYTIAEFARLGVGYAFGRFTQDILDDERDHAGFFLRVTGMY